MNKEDSPVKVIQGWTDPDIDMHPGRLSMSLLLRANANPGDVPCGVVIGSKAIPEGEVVKMEERIKKLELDLGLMTIDCDYYKKMEAACFLALQDRDAEIDDLKNQCMQMAHTLTTLDNPDPEPL